MSAEKNAKFMIAARAAKEDLVDFIVNDLKGTDYTDVRCTVASFEIDGIVYQCQLMVTKNDNLFLDYDEAIPSKFMILGGN